MATVKYSVVIYDEGDLLRVSVSRWTGGWSGRSKGRPAARYAMFVRKPSAAAEKDALRETLLRVSEQI